MSYFISNFENLSLFDITAEEEPFQMTTMLDGTEQEISISCVGRFPDPQAMTYFIEIDNEPVSFFKLNSQAELEVEIDTAYIPATSWTAILSEIKRRSARNI